MSTITQITQVERRGRPRKDQPKSMTGSPKAYENRRVRSCLYARESRDKMRKAAHALAEAMNLHENSDKAAGRTKIILQAADQIRTQHKRISATEMKMATLEKTVDNMARKVRDMEIELQMMRKKLRDRPDTVGVSIDEEAPSSHLFFPTNEFDEINFF